MQEVGGSIPPGSTTLRLRLRVAQPRKSRRRSVPGVARLGEDGLERQMWNVYIIRSIDFPEQEYIGATADLKRRLSEHNAGKSTHTAKFKPWKLTWYCAFPDKYKALAFEKYTLADILQRNVVTLPQHQHDKILRIGEPEPVEQRLVDAVEGVGGRIHREADLVVQPQRLFRREFPDHVRSRAILPDSGFTVGLRDRQFNREQLNVRPFKCKVTDLILYTIELRAIHNSPQTQGRPPC